MIPCEVCNTPVPRSKNSVVCSERCKEIRSKAFDIVNKYSPTNGCDNCWGDLYQGCTDKCKEEFRISGEHTQDLWELIRLIIVKEK